MENQKKLIIRNNDLENQIKNLQKNIVGLKKLNDIQEKKINRNNDLENELTKMMFSKWINNILFIIMIILLYFKL